MEWSDAGGRRDRQWQMRSPAPLWRIGRRLLETSALVTASLALAGVAIAATIDGPTDNHGAQIFSVTGDLVANDTFTNRDTARLIVNTESSFTGITTLNNSSTFASGGSGGISIGVLSTLSTNHVINAAGSTINNSGRLNSLLGPIVNAGTLNSGSDGAAGAGWSGGIVNTGTVNATGGTSGAIVNAGAGRFFALSLSADSTFVNQDMAQLTVGLFRFRDIGFRGLTSLTNTSAATVGVDVLDFSTLSVSGAVTNSGNIRVSGVLAAGSVDNQAGGSIIVNGRLNSGVANAGTFFTNIGATVSGLLTNAAGTTTNNGAMKGGANIVGGIFAGTGSVTNLTISGGVFAPGNGTAGS